MKDKQITVRIGEEVDKILNRYGDPISTQLRADLRALMSLVRSGVSTLSGKFSLQDYTILTKTFEDLAVDPNLVGSPMIGKLLADEFEKTLHIPGNGHFKISTEEVKSISTKLRKLSTVEGVSLLHLIKTYWHNIQTNEFFKDHSVKKAIKDIFPIDVV